MASVNIASSDNITGIRLKEQASSPTTPPSGYAQLYVNTTPAVQFEDDAGTVRTLSDTTHTHAAADITSGTLDNARVNWASPSAIGSGTASTLRGTTLTLTSTNNVGSNLHPSVNNTYDLGSTSARWRSVIASNSNFSQISTATSGSFITTSVDGTFSPASDYTQVPTNLQNTFTIGASGNQLTSAVVYGLNTHIIKSGTGSLIALRNTQARTTYSAGTVSTNRALGVLNEVSGGTITSLEGIDVACIITGSPTITDSVGIRIGNVGGVGVVNSYALTILAQSGSSATNIAIRTLGGDVIINDNGTTSNFIVESDTNANMLFVDGTNNRVGIGTSSPTRTLEVNGTIGSATTYSTTVGATNRALYVDNTGLIGYLSSRAGMKNSVVSLSTTYDTLMQQFEALNPVSFYYNNDLSGQRRFGLIAEEVDAINPHWVSYDPVLALNEETGEMYDTGELVPATVSYNDMISVLIAVVQHALDKIDELEAKVRDLERRLVRLEVKA